MMTTFAAIFGTLPIAIGAGAGAELRQPLGVAVVGGLCLSQLLTLYITPVVYIYLDRIDRRLKRRLEPQAEDAGDDEAAARGRGRVMRPARARCRVAIGVRRARAAWRPCRRARPSRSKSSTRICTTIGSQSRITSPTRCWRCFRKHRVTGILATSRPNTGTHALMDAKAEGLWVVPFIRPYRVRADIQTWFGDPVIFDLVQDEFKRGYYRGIGEFHLHGKSAENEWVKKTVDFAVANNLYLHAHSDDEADRDPDAPQSEGADHLGAYRLWPVDRSRRRDAGEISKAVGRTVLPQRHRRRRRAS